MHEIIDMTEDEAGKILTRFECEIGKLFSRPLSRTEFDVVLRKHRDLLQTDEVRKLAHVRKKPFDFLIDEFFAAIPVIDRYYAENNARFFFPRDNGPVDLRITLGTRSEECQITRAHDGQRSRLQNELLASTGHAPGTGTLYRDPRTKRAIGISEARDHNESIDIAVKWLSTALTKKAERTYPEGMTLICAISRWEFHLRDDKDWKILIDAASKLLPRLKFARIYLSDMYDGNFVHKLR